MRDKERVEAVVDRSSSLHLARAHQLTTREPEGESSGSEDQKGQKRPKKAQNISIKRTSTKIQYTCTVFAITTHGEARIGNEYQQPDLPGFDKKWTCEVRTQKTR